MNENSLTLLKKAIQYEELEEYKKAQELLDRIIETDPENHSAWYEKSKLPIVQEDNITIKNCSVSLSVYRQLPFADKNNYLQQCGFEITELSEIESRLRVSGLIANQRIKYLKMAIKYAPKNEKSVYTLELESLADITAKRNRKDVNAVISIGAIALVVSVLMVLMLNCSMTFLEVPFNMIIVILIPYALSVTGMTLYTRAKNNGNRTVGGFVCNLIALIISNLSIINALILLFNK